MKYQATAIALLLLTMSKATAWKWFPEAIQAEAWNACQAFMAATLLLLVALLYQSRLVWMAALWGIGMELQTAACSIAYMVKPWEINPGDELCSSGLGFPIGLLSAGMGLIVLQYLRTPWMGVKS